ncbi:hypothetical protein [Phenylobacterium sp. J367]|uniref:hypothetical protein n=1 Tax=Phenylobacterium sp. J367 TaxID=2898435 RepID=UPI002151F074|nr:hypothetical protein [Phenylobacterium sp. J367]MCR5877918.1 hypothetical protein [Phenylobacterium sp. J367]
MISSPAPTPHKVAHASLLGAMVLAVVFLLCWATEAVAGTPPTRAVLAFFGVGGMITPAQGVAGVGWAIISGGIVGALLAIFGDLLSNVGRRRSGA